MARRIPVRDRELTVGRAAEVTSARVEATRRLGVLGGICPACGDTFAQPLIEAPEEMAGFVVEGKADDWVFTYCSKKCDRGLVSDALDF